MAVRNKKRKGKQQPGRNRMLWLLLFIPIVAGIVFSIMPKSSRQPMGPPFQKEGTLQFISGQTGQALALIDIEVAADDAGRAKGLMWRRSMAGNQGMLFVMEREEMQSFWMLNTYISLDIIFVDASKRIVTIQPGTTPQSLKPVPSSAPALYVVEVNAGFCEKNGIALGDLIAFEILPGVK